MRSLHDVPLPSKSCAWFPERSDWEEMTNAPTILVVEDEDDSVLLLESAFRKAQFSNPMHRVAHGALAMEYLSQAVSNQQRPVSLPALAV